MATLANYIGNDAGTTTTFANGFSGSGLTEGDLFVSFVKTDQPNKLPMGPWNVGDQYSDANGAFAWQWIRVPPTPHGAWNQYWMLSDNVTTAKFTIDAFVVHGAAKRNVVGATQRGVGNSTTLAVSSITTQGKNSFLIADQMTAASNQSIPAAGGDWVDEAAQPAANGSSRMSYIQGKDAGYSAAAISNTITSAKWGGYEIEILDILTDIANSTSGAANTWAGPYLTNSQGAVTGAAGTNAIALSLPGTVAANNLLLAWCVGSTLGSSGSFSVSGTGWTMIDSKALSFSGSFAAFALAYLVPTSGSPAAPTFTLSGGATGSIAGSVHQYAGVDPSNPINLNNIVNANSGNAQSSAWSLASLKTTRKNSVVVADLMAATSTTTWFMPPPASGYVVLENDVISTAVCHCFADYQAAKLSTQSPSLSGNIKQFDAAAGFTSSFWSCWALEIFSPKFNKSTGYSQTINFTD